jgi:hypothetical protein
MGCTASVLSDTILLVAPLVLFQKITDKHLRMRLMFTFATCVATTISSLFHGACESRYAIQAYIQT